MSARARGRGWAVLLVLAAAAAACGDGGGGSGKVGLPGEWPTFSRSLDRTGFNATETVITKETVQNLVPRWHFPTGAPVPASPVVATIEVPDEGAVRAVVVGSYDGNVYAIRAADGTELWRFAVKPHPGVSYGLIASSATIAEVEGEQRVFVGGGMTMYAIDASTGEQVWEFDAGTGCTDCNNDTERNEILSSPAVLPEQDLVLFGMDINDRPPGKGGFYALSAEDGRLRWYFDLETGATCYPDDDDNVRRFDGYHTAEELGLPDDFFSTRKGCDFDRAETGCGSVWSPVSVDLERELLYFSSSNCDTDDDPQTPEPPPPMPKYDEALVAMTFDGRVAWSWRPREVDNDDLAFGAAPNLFTATVEGQEREVVGLGGKDGTYYLLDRDGENELTGTIEPYWQRQVVPGGDIGGMTGTPAVGEGRVYFGTALGESGEDPQAPFAWALQATDGELVWSSEEAPPFYGASSAVPGLVFMGGVDGQLHAYDAETGELLVALPLEGLGFSQPVIVGGEVFIGSGFGAAGAGGSDIAAQLAKSPAGVWAFCIEGQEGCERLATEEREALFSPQANQLDVYDLETGQISVLIPSDRNTVNGQVCLMPDQTGNFLLGEDTGERPGDPTGPRQGWGIFNPEGRLVKKIPEPESPGEARKVEPYGCGFDEQARLFVTDVGSGDFGSEDGKLIVFFPPDYDAYCLLDTKLQVAGQVAIDGEGNVYVPETVPPGRIFRFAPPFPTNPNECDSVPVNKSVFIQDPEMQTPMGIVQAPNGNWYISSVFLPTAIREYDPTGNFVRTIAEGDNIGNPAGISIDAQGTLYYADLGLVQEPGELPAPGQNTGTVRRIAFDEQGNPLPPETIGDGLDYPDAVSVLPLR